ncbi:MAG: signal peptide peptidase SppA [Candidatus Sungbacteria bacterium]|nr:signal peptide peptidase SppA [Candidatus Sungbacteria bacterium]
MADNSVDTRNDKLADKIVDTFFKEMRRERRLKYIRTVLMVILFTASMLVYVVFNSNPPFSSTSAPQRTYQTIWTNESGPAPKDAKLATIAVVPIIGTIDGDTLGEGSSPNMVSKVRNRLITIDGEKDKNLTALVFYIDSPGGTVTASHELYQMILDWKKKRNIRVIAYLHSVAASGGYYIAQAADEIIADETALTGSIGVVMSAMNFAELAKKVGVKNEVIKSGEFKDTGSPFRAMAPKERQIFQVLIDESYEKFLSVVADGRKGKLTEEEIRGLADGRVLSGKQAKALKLVDDNGTFNEMLTAEVKRITEEKKEFAGAKVVLYSTKEYSLFGEIFSKFSFSVNVLPFDEHTRRQRLMYLWLGGLPAQAGLN